jgi:glycosyltransferase involved in cell wall biosynthesis
MKLLRVIASANPVGGGPIEGIRQITPVLARMGYATELVSLDDAAAPYLADVEVPVHALGPVESTYCYSARLTPWIRANAANYDCVILHGLWQYVTYGSWRGLRGLSTPYFVFAHGMLDPWFKHAFPLKHLKKALYWPWAEYRVLRNAQAVCFTSEEERLLARQSFRPYHCRERVVNYGTAGPSGAPEALRETFLARFPELRDKRLILYLSRIHMKKGCDLLIKAFAQVANQDPRLHLVMAGPDKTDLRPSLEALATQHGVAQRITWTGMLSGNIKWGAFYASEAFALPSHQENFGIAVAEALACGVPVLISNKVNIWREIVEDEAGMAEADDQEGTTQLLQRWLALPQQAQQSMSQHARSCFLRRFEIEQAARSLVETLGCR